MDVAPDIDGYFEQVVSEALRARRVDATDAAQHYLAGLLIDYARGEQATETLERPLTFLLNDALSSAGADRFERLRRIGDGVLYVLGFFGSGFTRRGADPGYAMSVGSSAYGHAAAMLRLSGPGAVPDVLGELANGFARFVEVMSEIADGAMAASTEGDESVLRLYQRWQQTGSDRLAGELASLGVCPLRAPGGVH